MTRSGWCFVIHALAFSRQGLQDLNTLERAPMVTDNRNAFQAAMQDRFIAAVEQLSGRRVVHFISSHNVGPDLEVELFFLADAR